MTDYDLKQLKQAGEEAVTIAKRHKGDFKEAINWGDLHCTAALKVEDDYGQIHYRVEIEEAAPDCNHFSGFIRKRLEEAGYPDVSVWTEW